MEDKVKRMPYFQDLYKQEYSVESRNKHFLTNIEKHSGPGKSTISVIGNGHLLLHTDNPELPAAIYLRNELRRGADMNPYAILAMMPEGVEENVKLKR